MKANPVAVFDLLLGVAVVIATFLPRRRPQDDEPDAVRLDRWKGKVFLFFRLMGAVLILLALLRLLGVYGTP